MKLESGGNIYYPDRILKISYIEDRLSNGYIVETKPYYIFFVDIIIGGKVEEIRFKFDTIEEAERVRNEIIELADKQV
jgi:hypothetical protein